MTFVLAYFLIGLILALASIPLADREVGSLHIAGIMLLWPIMLVGAVAVLIAAAVERWHWGRW